MPTGGYPRLRVVVYLCAGFPPLALTSERGRESHTFAVRSIPPVTTRAPSGLNATEPTAPACPLRVRSSAPVFASHTRAVPSLLAVTTRAPSGLNAAEV